MNLHLTLLKSLSLNSLFHKLRVVITNLIGFIVRIHKLQGSCHHAILTIFRNCN
jgi:hypothetical protein